MKAAIATAVVLSVAAVAAVVLATREGQRAVSPAQLLAHPDDRAVELVGFVVSKPRYRGGLEFDLTDKHHRARVLVHYAGPAVDLARGEKVSVTGRYRHGVFGAEPDSLVAGCAIAGGATHC